MLFFVVQGSPTDLPNLTDVRFTKQGPPGPPVWSRYFVPIEIDF